MTQDQLLKTIENYGALAFKHAVAVINAGIDPMDAKARAKIPEALERMQAFSEIYDAINSPEFCKHEFGYRMNFCNTCGISKNNREFNYGN